MDICQRRPAWPCTACLRCPLYILDGICWPRAEFTPAETGPRESKASPLTWDEWTLSTPGPNSGWLQLRIAPFGLCPWPPLSSPRLDPHFSLPLAPGRWGDSPDPGSQGGLSLNAEPGVASHFCQGFLRRPRRHSHEREEPELRAGTTETQMRGWGMGRNGGSARGVGLQSAPQHLVRGCATWACRASWMPRCQSRASCAGVTEATFRTPRSAP